jgi:hypothetical protein
MNDHTFENYFWRYIKNLFIIKYYIFSIMKTRFFLASSVLLIGFLSCKKTDMIQLPLTVPDTPVDVTKLTDSCFYTLDGIPYICDYFYSRRFANRGANLDTNGGWKWDPDTLLYSRSYSIRSSGVYGYNGGDLTITFAKKFAKSQLTRNVGFNIMGPRSDSMLYYPKGEQKYAVDFDGFNRYNGVALDIPTDIGSVGGFRSVLRTYSEQVYIPTNINTNSQKDSKFVITNVYFFPPNGSWLESHILEAKFSAIVFDRWEMPHRLENGYIRIHIE